MPGAAWFRGARLNFAENRITSYNVCYTKLLRFSAKLRRAPRNQVAPGIVGFSSTVSKGREARTPANDQSASQKSGLQRIDQA